MDDDFAFFPEDRLGDMVLPRHWQVSLLCVGALNALVAIIVLTHGMLSSDLGACFGLFAAAVLVASSIPAIRVALHTGWSRHAFKSQATLALSVALAPYVIALAFLVKLP